ncbi:MAG: DUF5995 family protein [Candidatus Sericytochromatia bacterium]
MPRTTPPPAPIPNVTTIDEVVEALDSIIRWSIEASSRLGYFAALYKRVTIAVKVALEQGGFEDGPRMERFDVAFAGRYFAAMNGFFHPRQYRKPTHSWQVTFDAAQRTEPIIVQHMLGGINAHIGLDLGIVAQTIAAGVQLPTLQEDFNRLNAVLASQISGVVEDINELSPVLADLYAALQEQQIALINEAVRSFRDSAWRFATLLAASPDVVDPGVILARDLHVAQQGALIYSPPVPIAVFVSAIAARESRDVIGNLRVLDHIASKPAPISMVL